MHGDASFRTGGAVIFGPIFWAFSSPKSTSCSSRVLVPGRDLRVAFEFSSGVWISRHNVRNHDTTNI
eukprot:5776860-Pyramimonas_sp.AAC.1